MGKHITFAISVLQYSSLARIPRAESTCPSYSSHPVTHYVVQSEGQSTWQYHRRPCRPVDFVLLPKSAGNNTNTETKTASSVAPNPGTIFVGYSSVRTLGDTFLTFRASFDTTLSNSFSEVRSTPTYAYLLTLTWLLCMPGTKRVFAKAM